VTQGQEGGNEPQVAFDGQGDALALWSRIGRRNEEGQYEWELLSSSMPAGGVWQASVEVSAPGLAGTPQVVVNAQGEAEAVWNQWTHGFLSTRTVQAASKPARGAWQSPVTIVSEGDEIGQPKGAGNPGIAVDGQGDAIAVWTSSFSDTVQAAFKSAGGAWQAPVEISGEGAYAPQVAFDGHGDALAIWDGEDGTVQSGSKPAGGAWQAPVDIGHGGGPQVAFDEQGDAVAAWVGEHGVEAAGYAATGPALNDVSIPTEGTVGQPLTFSVSPFDVWSISGETSWSFGDGASASGTSVTHTYTTAGTYEVTIHSADTLGNVTSTTGKVTIAPAPASPTPSSPESTSTGPDTSTATTPLVTLMASELVVSGGSAPVRVACRAAACRGSIELTMQVLRQHSRGKTAISRRATLILATGSFSLTEGKRGTVVLHLTTAGRKTLAHASKHHPIAARLILSVKGGKPTSKPVLAV